jgi:NADP-reducing hydrogenase subunit HndD
MPCTAKKYEKERPQNAAVETSPRRRCGSHDPRTRGHDQAGWPHLGQLPEEKFDDDLLGEYTGAGAIFGVTGGVMEAALRTAYHTLNGKEHDPIEFKAVRGFEASKKPKSIWAKPARSKSPSPAAWPTPNRYSMQSARASRPTPSSKSCAARVAASMAAVSRSSSRPLLTNGDESILDTYRQKRADILYSIDEKKSVRQSHNNPDIIRLYKDYLGEYGSEKAEELLHTSYVKDREQFPVKK